MCFFSCFLNFAELRCVCHGVQIFRQIVLNRGNERSPNYVRSRGSQKSVVEVERVVWNVYVLHQRKGSEMPNK